MTSYRLLAVGLLLATSQAPLPASAQTGSNPALPS